MPTFLFGHPLHPLVVHAGVVVPAAVIGTVLVAVWPRARSCWAWSAVVVTALARANNDGRHLPMGMTEGDRRL